MPLSRSLSRSLPLLRHLNLFLDSATLQDALVIPGATSPSAGGKLVKKLLALSGLDAASKSTVDCVFSGSCSNNDTCEDIYHVGFHNACSADGCVNVPWTISADHKGRQGAIAVAVDGGNRRQPRRG